MSPSDDAFLAFGRSVFSHLDVSAFGSLAKSELDLVVFRALLDAGFLSMDMTNFELARQLQLPVARVQTLKFAIQMRSSTLDENALLSSGISFIARSSNSTTLVFSIEDRFTRELAIARLKQVNTFTDTSFNRERLSVSTADFDTFVDVLFPQQAAKMKSEVARIKRKEGLETAADVVLAVLKGATSGFAVALINATTGL